MCLNLWLVLFISRLLEIMWHMFKYINTLNLRMVFGSKILDIYNHDYNNSKSSSNIQVIQ